MMQDIKRLLIAVSQRSYVESGTSAHIRVRVTQMEKIKVTAVTFVNFISGSLGSFKNKTNDNTPRIRDTLSEGRILYASI